MARKLCVFAVLLTIAIFVGMISSRVAGVLAALLAILVITFIVNVRGAARLADLNAAVTRDREVLDRIETARTALHDVENARRGYVLTGANEFVELYVMVTKESVGRLDRLRELVADDPAQRRRIDAIGVLVARELALITDAIATTDDRTRQRPAPQLAEEGQVVTEQMRALIDDLEQAQRSRLRMHDGEADIRTAKVIRGFAAIALVALLLLGAAYYVLDRDAAVHSTLAEQLQLQHRMLETLADDAPSAGERARIT
jgi:CHASE3 domain sensor protein